MICSRGCTACHHELAVTGGEYLDFPKIARSMHHWSFASIANMNRFPVISSIMLLRSAHYNCITRVHRLAVLLSAAILR